MRAYASVYRTVRDPGVVSGLRYARWGHEMWVITVVT